MKKIPHTFTIVFALILLAAVCTWLVPAGEFVRETVTIQNADGSTATREVVQTGSFHYVESQPQTWQVFSSLFNGFVDKADIIIFILMVGGAFWILNNSHAIDVGVMAFLRRILRLNKYRLLQRIGVENIIIALIMIMFSLFGAVFGMSEETIAFVIIFVPLAISMGYDSIVGVCMCYVAAHIGFAGAMLNPFTIGIAQGIAELPIFSGLEYRFLCWIVLTIIGIAFVQTRQLLATAGNGAAGQSCCIPFSYGCVGYVWSAVGDNDCLRCAIPQNSYHHRWGGGFIAYTTYPSRRIRGNRILYVAQVCAFLYSRHSIIHHLLSCGRRSGLWMVCDGNIRAVFSHGHL